MKEPEKEEEKTEEFDDKSYQGIINEILELYKRKKEISDEIKMAKLRKIIKKMMELKDREERKSIYDQLDNMFQREIEQIMDDEAKKRVNK